jgi:ubiquinone/menaquinone biosynthesis C-methylase UbiE
MANDRLRAGDYYLAVEGLALIRTCITEPSRSAARVAEITAIVEHYDEFPNSLEIPLTEHAVEPGYSMWAETYDGPNPAIDAEKAVVLPMLEALPPGDALDAACGTGRHAVWLAAHGHHVIGVDTTEAMLDVARSKVPDADFRLGRLEALPVDDASVDLVTCALALTHVVDLEPVMREFARVLRPGGVAVLSDIHPMITMTGGMAAFPGEDITKGIPFVVNRTHQTSTYLAAFRAAGLTVTNCVEPPLDENVLRMMPSYPFSADATAQAFSDMPYLLIWQLEK